MDFEWDDAKAKANVQKHGVSFHAAAEALAGWVVRKRDLRFDYGEDRWVAIGRHGGTVVVVAFTLRGATVRIISARRANRHERRIYDDATQDRLQ